MALPILDGNQSATTLSSVVTGGEHIVAHTVVSLGSTAISNITSAISGSVVSVSNFPSTQTIAGTVTANVGNSITLGALPYTTTITGVGSQFGQGGGLAGSVVTAVPVILSSNGNIGGSLMSYDGSNTSLNVNIKGTVPAISGTVTANNTLIDNAGDSYQARGYSIGALGAASEVVGPSIDGAVIVNGLPAVPISGTVTANNPSGALITRFGSVTTANTAQLTSAVTNTSRKYLLVQNIATSTVTIGIGFAPTTTQGIQLTAGAGLTFDAFCPTGGVWWLSSTTGSNFSILEG
jgi:hypothetical protein